MGLEPTLLRQNQNHLWLGRTRKQSEKEEEAAGGRGAAGATTDQTHLGTQRRPSRTHLEQLSAPQTLDWCCSEGRKRRVSSSAPSAGGLCSRRLRVQIPSDVEEFYFPSGHLSNSKFCFLFFFFSFDIYALY